MSRTHTVGRCPAPGLAKRFALSALAILATAQLLGCAPSTLKQRNGYWADQSLSAQAYNHRVRFLVLHYTDSGTRRSLKTLTGPHVSVQYVVAPNPRDRGGKPIVYQLVPENERAWHAGVSSWRSRHHLNDTSIGIEIVNDGPIPGGWAPYPAPQVKAVIALAHDIIKRYGIKPQNVVGHSDIAPGRKTDPGPAFPWYALYRAGIGAWPNPALVKSYEQQFRNNPPSIGAMQRQLHEYGYDLPITGIYDTRTKKTLSAFQMHFRPRNYSGMVDTETEAELWALNAQYR